jgi:signal transduction histidine kinase
LVLSASIALLLAAAATSALALRRSGETRVLLLTALLVLLAAQQGAVLWNAWGRSLGFDVATGAALLALAASALALPVVLTVAGALRELDRAESLHWRSMQGVRAVTELAADRGRQLEERLGALLEMACARLDLPVGVFARVVQERVEVVAVHAPEGSGLVPGRTLEIEKTLFAETLEADRPLAVEALADSRFAAHPARTALGIESWLAGAVRVGEESYGALAFAGATPRRERITASHKDLVALMAHWVGSELERRALDRERAASQRALAMGSAGRRQVARRVADEPRPAARARESSARGVDLNALVSRLERRVRRLTGPRVELVLKPCRALWSALDGGLPLDSVLLSLVANAIDAMPDGGRLTLATANLEVPPADPGSRGVRGPHRFVTLAVSDTSSGVDADALAHVFDAPPEQEGRGEPLAAGRLTLASVYRILHRCGGDLSVDVDPFTVFLPARDERASAPRVPAPAPPPPAPAGSH